MSADDEDDDLKDLVDSDFKPSLVQKGMVHGHSSGHRHENPDVKNLGDLSKQVLGKDVKSPKEKEKEEQKRIFAKAARTEAMLKKSLAHEVRATCAECGARRARDCTISHTTAYITSVSCLQLLVPSDAHAECMIMSRKADNSAPQCLGQVQQGRRRCAARGGSIVVS